MAKKKKKLLLPILLGALLILAGGGYYSYWTIVKKPNLNAKSFELFIATGSHFNDVLEDLRPELINPWSFEFLSERMQYQGQVRPGRYLLNNNMSNEDMIRKLRSGQQDPVSVTVQHARYIEELAGIFAKKLEGDSQTFCSVLLDSMWWQGKGFKKNQQLLAFIPNTYQFNWNSTPTQVAERFLMEYDKFWSGERRQLADSLHLTPIQIGIMAWMLNKETNQVDEMPRMAGVFMNRLNKDMLLQVDPTVIFAWGDFSIRRVLNYHLAIDHPYNTYRYKGLPPGPIGLPTISAIDAVLHYEKHTYIYYCARPDGSGHHNFASSQIEHMKNARLYHQVQNAKKNKS